jgi:hypothetical protein
MRLTDLKLLDNLYKLYRFDILPIKNDHIRAYAYTSKYFANADIILLNGAVSTESINKVIKEVSDLGFATNLRSYTSIEEAEQKLFEGFFDIENSIKVLNNSYNDYKSKISEVIFNEYQYINSRYYDAESESYKEDDLVDTIFKDFHLEGPVLIVLEAAAGFGKTSTSYEVVNKMVVQLNFSKIPLFAELSRNRQATIFKYVLYDEINRKFTGISLELVYKHIIEGRIPVIIDGFDELLKSSKDDKREERFEDAEPMLETIRELLHGDAKILLTTRRTAIFAGDDFHLWIENNANNFSFKRYSISTPTIGDWIAPSREKELLKVGLNLKGISNPVLLAYIRNMNEETFQRCINNVDLIIEEYITKLMQRERDRQDLLMTVPEQTQILRLISSYFINYDVTSESKEGIEKLIFDSKQALLFDVIERYPADRKPTLDQLTAKLTMHAFLDRKGDTNQQIGFVNDFILGTFVGENLLQDKEDWFCTERFIDFLLTAYSPRSLATKRSIYNVLDLTVFSLLNTKRKIYIDNYLYGGINHAFQNEFIEDMEFRDNFNFDQILNNLIFSNCQFFNIVFDFSKLKDIFFINCKFYNSLLNISVASETNVTFTNCYFEPEIYTDIISVLQSEQVSDVAVNPYEKHVLERFWPFGRDRFIPHRRIGTLRMGVPPEEISHIDDAIDSLIRRGIIFSKERGQHSVDLNIAKLNEIKQILGR